MNFLFSICKECLFINKNKNKVTLLVYREIEKNQA